MSAYYLVRHEQNGMYMTDPDRHPNGALYTHEIRWARRFRCVHVAERACKVTADVPMPIGAVFLLEVED